MKKLLQGIAFILFGILLWVSEEILNDWITCYKANYPILNTSLVELTEWVIRFSAMITTNETYLMI